MTQAQETKMQTTLTVAHHDFERSLNAYAFFKVHNHDTGEDLVQDTFLKTWKYLVKGGRIEIMKAFLYHILNNLIVDEYRKKKTTSLDALVENGYEPGEDVSEQLLDRLDGKAALVLIKNLPQKYQKVMRMKYIQLLSLKEMSLISGQSKNAVAVQAHRGLERLKILYDHPANIRHIYA